MIYISHISLLPEEAKSAGYWVHGDSVYDLPMGIHIQFIEENPELFHISPEEIKQTYAKYNEKPGVEGKAREEIIKKVSLEGWVRVRHYIRPDYWSIQCDSIRRRTHTIENFLHWAFEHKVMRPSDEAAITGFADNSREEYAWENGGIRSFLMKESVLKEFDQEYFNGAIRMNLENLRNRAVFHEAALSRVLSHGKTGFMILTAFLQNNTIEENYRNTRALKRMLKEEGLGYFELIGFWDESLMKQEATAIEPDVGTTRNMNRMQRDIRKAGELHKQAGGGNNPSMELSLFVPFSQGDPQKILEKGIELGTHFHQSAIIATDVQRPEINLINTNISNGAIGSVVMKWSGITLTNISMAYSRLRSNPNRSFMYEGVTVHNSVFGCMVAKEEGYILSENNYFLTLALQLKEGYTGLIPDANAAMEGNGLEESSYNDTFDKSSLIVDWIDNTSEKDFRLIRLFQEVPKDAIYSEMEHGADVKGLETVPHVTIATGLDEAEIKQTRRLVGWAAKKFPPEFKMLEINIFSQMEYDVLHIPLQSFFITRLQSALAHHLHSMDNKDRSMIPHITLAYIKKGTCRDWIGRKVEGLTGETIQLRVLDYILPNRKKYQIELTDNDEGFIH